MKRQQLEQLLENWSLNSGILTTLNIQMMDSNKLIASINFNCAGEHIEILVESPKIGGTCDKLATEFKQNVETLGLTPFPVGVEDRRSLFGFIFSSYMNWDEVEIKEYFYNWLFAINSPDSDKYLYRSKDDCSILLPQPEPGIYADENGYRVNVLLKTKAEADSLLLKIKEVKVDIDSSVQIILNGSGLNKSITDIILAKTTEY